MQKRNEILIFVPLSLFIPGLSLWILGQRWAGMGSIFGMFFCSMVPIALLPRIIGLDIALVVTCCLTAIFWLGMSGYTFWYIWAGHTAHPGREELSLRSLISFYHQQYRRAYHPYKEKLVGAMFAAPALGVFLMTLFAISNLNPSFHPFAWALFFAYLLVLVTVGFLL